jgi:uncharacterized protein
MQLEIIFVIILTSSIQSVFGTGVLLFGTPLLLIAGYDFQNILPILLPTSILINFFQLKNQTNEINFNFYIKLVILSVPFIILFLYFVTTKLLNITPLVGLFLIIISLKDIIPVINRNIKFINEYEPIFLIITGIIHGLTNLGGSLLSALIINKNLTKESTRATIAICYLTFAIFQIITLIVFVDSNLFISKPNLTYWFIGLIMFFIVEKFIFLKINKKNYIKYFTSFLFITGFLLIINNY